MYLPGVAGHYASAPDSAALSVTGDVDIRAKIAPNSWTPAAAQGLVYKWAGAGSRSYSLYLDTTGKLVGNVTTDGTTGKTATSSAAVTPTSSPLWVRFTLAVATGASNFYTSSDGTSWSALGTQQTIAGSPFAIADTDAILAVGMSSNTASNPFTGRIYRAQVLNGIDGTIVFDADFTDRGNSFAEDSSNHATVTIWGRLQGYEPTWLTAEALYGNANHYGYEPKKLDAPEPAPKTTFPAATGGTTYPVAR